MQSVASVELLLAIQPATGNQSFIPSTLKYDAHDYLSRVTLASFAADLNLTIAQYSLIVVTNDQ